MSQTQGAAQTWGCARHARMGPTCCQVSEVLVTAGDKERIAERTARTDFWEHRHPQDPSYLDQEDDPNWIRWAFRPDGTRPVLKRDPGTGDCTFLRSDGCALPMETRPVVCRLFPYEYTEQGLTGIGSGCPAQVVPPGSSVLQMLGVVPGDAERWHALLYEELRTARRADGDGDRR